MVNLFCMLVNIDTVHLNYICIPCLSCESNSTLIDHLSHHALRLQISIDGDI